MAVYFGAEQRRTKENVIPSWARYVIDASIELWQAGGGYVHMPAIGSARPVSAAAREGAYRTKSEPQPIDYGIGGHRLFEFVSFYPLFQAGCRTHSSSLFAAVKA